MKNKKGIVSEFIPRTLAVIALLAIFFVFSFLFNLRGCTRGSTIHRTYDKYYYTLETTTNQILQSEHEFAIGVSVYKSFDKDYIDSLKELEDSEDLGNEKGLAFKTPVFEIPELTGDAKDTYNKLKSEEIVRDVKEEIEKNFGEERLNTVKKEVELSIEDAIALWAQYNEMIGINCDDFNDELKPKCWNVFEDSREILLNRIFYELSYELCSLDKSFSWKAIHLITHPGTDLQSHRSVLNIPPTEPNTNEYDVSTCLEMLDVARTTSNKEWAPCEIVSVFKQIPLLIPSDENDFVLLEIQFYDCASSREFEIGDSYE